MTSYNNRTIYTSSRDRPDGIRERMDNAKATRFGAQDSRAHLGLGPTPASVTSSRSVRGVVKAGHLVRGLASNMSSTSSNKVSHSNAKPFRGCAKVTKAEQGQRPRPSSQKRPSQVATQERPASKVVSSRTSYTR